MEPSGAETHNGLGFESHLVPDLMDLGGLSDDQLPVSKVTPMADTSATTVNNQMVDVCNNREGLNLVNSQQSTLTACTDFLNSTQQLGSSFGCIPLTPILLYQGTQKIWKNVSEVLQAHKTPYLHRLQFHYPPAILGIIILMHGFMCLVSLHANGLLSLEFFSKCHIYLMI